MCIRDSPPGSHKIAGSLLESVHMRMEADIHNRDAAGQLSERFGLTYTSDGWEDCNSTPLINSAYILANDGGVYKRSVDTSGMTKSSDYTANLMLEDIYSIGPTKVVCVVTDTCPTMRKAWKNVESEFPWISCCPCQAHCVSLLLNDIGKVPEAARTLKDETLVVGWCRAAPYCPSPLDVSIADCRPRCITGSPITRSHSQSFVRRCVVSSMARRRS